MSLSIPFLKNSKISLFHIGLGCAVAVCLVLTVPQFLRVGKICKQVTEKRKVLQDLEQGIETFSAMEQERDSLNNAFNDFFDRLPAQKEFPVFLELISKIARNHDVKIIAIEPQKVIEDANPFYVKIPVLIDAYCGYHALGGFINDLEFADKLMKVENIKINSDETNPGTHQVFLIIHTFCLRENVNATINK
ncbi:MAG: type 4a pilus biogenesis protein PilO [Candidatus Omnitrophica bacterium]|nr:type 4a pilus biogenesis protein PilO [Candidatus Omnitrophota bacterium]